MQARMRHPAITLPTAQQGVQALLQASKEGGVPQATLELVHLRVSQINGCSYCVESSARLALQTGVTDTQLFAVAAWRESPHFNDAERAALALAEAATRMADRPDPVPDEIWNEAARYYDEKGMAALLIMIGLINLLNRLYSATRQIAGVDHAATAHATA